MIFVFLFLADFTLYKGSKFICFTRTDSDAFLFHGSYSIVCVCVCKYTQAGIGQSEPQSPAGSAPAWRCYSGSQPQNPLGAAQQGDQAVGGLREFVSGAPLTLGQHPQAMGSTLPTEPHAPCQNLSTQPPIWGTQMSPRLPCPACALGHKRSLPLWEPHSLALLTSEPDPVPSQGWGQEPSVCSPP